MLFDAVQSNEERLVRALIRRGVPVDSRTRNGETVLGYAARFGHMGIISLLLSYGADPNAADNDGYTPILFPCNVGDKVAKMLIRYGARVNATTHKGHSALHAAAGQGDFATVDLLLNVGAAPDVVDHEGTTPLIDAAKGRDRGRVQVAERLLGVGANLYARDQDGRTAFLWATRFGNINLTRLLLSSGADSDDTDYEGNTALSYMETQLGWAEAYSVVDFLETHRFLMREGESR